MGTTLPAVCDVPLAILAADAAQALTARRSTALALVAAAVLALWTDRSAYKELRAAKNTYGRVVDFVAHESGDGEYIVSDVWWLDQVAALPASRRQWLYVPDNAEGLGLVTRLSNATVPVVTTFRLQSQSTLRDWIESSAISSKQPRLSPSRI